MNVDGLASLVYYLSLVGECLMWPVGLKSCLGSLTRILLDELAKTTNFYGAFVCRWSFLFLKVEDSGE